MYLNLFLSLLICTFGMLSNAFMIVLLIKPKLGTTINRLLALEMLSGTLLMLSNFVYVIHFELASDDSCPVDLLTYGWVIFWLLHSNWSVYLRAFSLWLSVVMAGYRKRVLSEKTPHRKENLLFSIKLAFVVALGLMISCIPVFLQNTIQVGPTAPENDTVCPRNHSIYFTLRPPHYALWNDRLLLKLAYWMNGILLKLCPIALLAYYLVRVVAVMNARRKRRQRMLSRTGIPQICQNGRNVGTTKCGATMMPTSAILVTILLTTVLCEMPNAILSVMSGFLPDTFVWKVYVERLGEVMDLLSLISCTSTSTLYFVMSKSLRKAFVETFLNLGANSNVSPPTTSSTRMRTGSKDGPEAVPLTTGTEPQAILHIPKPTYL